MLQTLGHKWISLSHYCCDRALFSSLDRVLRQRHGLYREVAAEAGGQGELGKLLDWVISTGCANHDAQNGLKWGLAWLDCGDEAAKKLYIAIESVRNGFDLVLKHMPAFLLQVVSVVDDNPRLADSSQ